VTAEVAGVTAQDRLGPHLAPAIAWIRRQPGGLTLMLGGRNLAAPCSLVGAVLRGGVRRLEWRLPGSRAGWHLRRRDVSWARVHRDCHRRARPMVAGRSRHRLGTFWRCQCPAVRVSIARMGIALSAFSRAPVHPDVTRPRQRRRPPCGASSTRAPLARQPHIPLREAVLRHSQSVSVSTRISQGVCQ